MKKVAFLALVLWGLGYFYGKTALETWLPISKIERSNPMRYPPEAQRELQEPGAPAAASPSAAGAKWMEQEKARVGRWNVDPEKASRQLRNYGNCTSARGSLAANSVVERSPNTFVATHRGKVLTEAERIAAREENEKFIKENCRP